LAASAATGTAASGTTAATTSAAAARTTGGSADDGIRSRAESMARGPAERVENGNNHHGDPNNQECIFGCILAGLLMPKSLEGLAHDEHLELEGTTPGLRFR
jgi:hypothetical protein